jgi:O-antigen/teichoic acid export membrane protein
MNWLTDKALLTSIVLVGMRATTLACKLGLVIFVGRYLDLASLGLYGLAVGATTIGPVVVGLGIVHVVMREAVTAPLEQLTTDLRYYWGYTTSMYCGLLAIVFAVAFATDATPLATVVVAIMLFEHLGNDIFLLLSNLERPFVANSNAFLRGAAWILVYLPVALWDPYFRSLTALFGFWLGGSILALLHFVWVSRSWPWKSSFHRARWTWLPATIKGSFVVYISDLTFVAGQYVDRYVVSALLGLELAGVYFLYWSAGNAVATFVNIAVLQIERPRLIKAYRKAGLAAHRKLVSGCVRRTAIASACFSIVVACVFYVVLPLLRQPAVADQLGAFWLIMAAMAFRNISDVGALALFTARRDRPMTLTTAAALILLVMAQALLLPLWGLYGAGAAILIASVIVALWRHQLLFGRSADQSPQPVI